MASSSVFHPASQSAIGEHENVHTAPSQDHHQPLKATPVGNVGYSTQTVSMDVLCCDKSKSWGGGPHWPELSAAAGRKPLTDERLQLLPANRMEPRSVDQKSTATVSRGWCLLICLVDTILSLYSIAHPSVCLSHTFIGAPVTLDWYTLVTPF